MGRFTARGRGYFFWGGVIVTLCMIAFFAAGAWGWGLFALGVAIGESAWWRGECAATRTEARAAYVESARIVAPSVARATLSTRLLLPAPDVSYGPARAGDRVVDVATATAPRCALRRRSYAGVRSTRIVDRRMGVAQAVLHRRRDRLEPEPARAAKRPPASPGRRPSSRSRWGPRAAPKQLADRRVRPALQARARDLGALGVLLEPPAAQSPPDEALYGDAISARDQPPLVPPHIDPGASPPGASGLSGQRSVSSVAAPGGGSPSSRSRRMRSVVAATSSTVCCAAARVRRTCSLSAGGVGTDGSLGLPLSSATVAVIPGRGGRPFPHLDHLRARPSTIDSRASGPTDAQRPAHATPRRNLGHWPRSPMGAWCYEGSRSPFPEGSTGSSDRS